MEARALSYLEQEGLTLLTRNFQCAMGEIDLIMKDKQTLVFIEVRYRKTHAWGGALSSISLKKQRCITKTALFYLQKHPLFQKMDLRFDVVAIEDSAPPLWVRNAFNNPL